MTLPTLQRDHGRWADDQVQQALTVLLPEINSDWFEDHSAEFQVWLAKAVRRHLDEALSHRRTAHFMRRNGHIGSFKQWIHDAIREVRMAKHYARRIEL